MTDLNKCITIGRCTKDPELKYTQNGSAVCSFSLAVNHTYTSNGEKKEHVSFFNYVAWGKTGEAIAQYCKKGQRLAVEGSLQQRRWAAQDGTKRSIVEIVVERIQFLQPRENGAQGEAPSGIEDIPPSGDDIPFEPRTKTETMKEIKVKSHS